MRKRLFWLSRQHRKGPCQCPPLRRRRRMSKPRLRCLRSINLLNEFRPISVPRWTSFFGRNLLKCAACLPPLTSLKGPPNLLVAVLLLKKGSLFYLDCLFLYFLILCMVVVL